jgi:hypothetical protein
MSEALTWRLGARGCATLGVSLLVAAGWACVGYEVFALVVDAAVAGRWSGVPILGALLAGLVWVLAYLTAYILNAAVIRVALDGDVLSFRTPLGAFTIDLSAAGAVTFLGASPGLRFVAFDTPAGTAVMTSLLFPQPAFDAIQTHIETVLLNTGRAGVLAREAAPPRDWSGASFRFRRLREIAVVYGVVVVIALGLAIALHWNAPALHAG